MLGVSFFEGLSMAHNAYQMHQINLKISALEETVLDGTCQFSNLNDELAEFKKGIDSISSFRAAMVRTEAMKLLGDIKRSSASNADAIYIFVSSIGPFLISVTYKGGIQPTNTFGSNQARGLIKVTMD